MPFLNYITWTVDPELIDFGFLHIRWYGVLFATGFLLGYYNLTKIHANEGIGPKKTEQILIYMMVAVILGARLGHVFFYEWDYYSQNLWEIPMIWKGGLASHGATIAILIALWLYARKVVQKPISWVLDTTSAGVAMGAAFVRFGNLMNHEIIGKVTDVPWAFIFTRVDNQPRHPVQLYEAFSYLFICALINYLYWKTSAKDKPWVLTGTLLVTLFGARFIIEIFKKSQGGFETYLGDALTTGQWLSIPFVILGLFLMIRGWRTSR